MTLYRPKAALRVPGGSSDPEGTRMAKDGKKSGERSNRIIGRRYRYTGDYKVVRAIGAGGRHEKRVIYTGEWIRPTNDEFAYKRLVRMIWALLAAAILAVVGAVQIVPPPMTNKWYVPVLMVSVFPLAYQVLGAFRIPPAVTCMERQHFDKSFVRVGQSAVFAFVVMCLAALVLLIYWIVAAVGTIEGETPYSVRDAGFALLLAAAASAELLIRRLCRRITTETLENSAYHP